MRGTAASSASFAGAFGMLPNAAVIGPFGAFVAEIWMTGLLLFLISAITDAGAKSVPDAAAPALIGTSVGAPAARGLAVPSSAAAAWPQVDTLAWPLARILYRPAGRGAGRAS